MPFLLLLALALTVGLVVGLVAWGYPRRAELPSAPALDGARKVGETIGRHPTVRTVRPDGSTPQPRRVLR